MEANEPQAKKVDQKELKHEYEVQDNGDVKVIQTQIVELTYDAREFISLYRGNESALEETKNSYSEEHIQKMQEQEKKIEAEIERMKPIREESEKKAKEEYERTLTEGMTTQLKKAIEDTKINEGWWVNIWNRGNEERKKKVLNNLTEEEKSKYLKIMQKLKRKGLCK